MTYWTVVWHMNPAKSLELQFIIQQATKKFLQSTFIPKSQCYSKVEESTLTNPIEGLFIQKIIQNISQQNEI